MLEINIKPLEEKYIDQLVEMEYYSWHEYYSQYEIYDTIKSSVTKESIASDWAEFISEQKNTSGPLITSGERKAYIALLDEELIGIAGVTEYKENIWHKIDEILKDSNGKIKKTAKFQNLYIDKNHRGHLVGHHLGVVRADYMIKKGYQAIFMTTYKDAFKTNQYHEKNGMKHIYDYTSLQTYDDGKKADISCFLNQDIKAYRDDLKRYIDQKLSQGIGYKLGEIIY